MEFIKKISWFFVKLLYHILAIGSILTIIWYIGSNYYYNIGYDNGVKDISISMYKKASSSCSIVIGPKSKEVKLININCIKNRNKQDQDSKKIYNTVK